MTDAAPYPPLPPGTKCPRCNYEIGVPDAAACPECGLATDLEQRAMVFRAECLKKLPWFCLLYFLVPALFGWILLGLRPIALRESIEAGVRAALFAWACAVALCFPLSLVSSKAERWLWSWLWVKVLPELATPLLAIPIIVALANIGVNALTWAVIVMTGLLLGVTNVFAWRERCKVRRSLLLRSRLGLTSSLILHGLISLLVGGVTILATIGQL